MEANPKGKTSKPSAKNGLSHQTLRVKMETKKRILQELNKINRKDFGCKVRVDDLVLILLNRVTEVDHQRLQEASMSGLDRLKRDHKNYLSENETMSWDEYLWKRANGELNPKCSTELNPTI